MTEERFTAKIDEGSTKLSLTIGNAAPMQTTFQLTSAGDVADASSIVAFVGAMGRALLRSQTQVEAFQKTNAEKDDVLR